MKKFLKKINRGVILTVVLLLGVVIYLVALSAVQAREKPVLENLCRQYVEKEIAYLLLPEQYRPIEAEVPDAELATYIAEMENAIRPFYIENEQIFQLAVDRISARLQGQAEGWSRILVYEKSIQDFNSFEFDGNKVTVKFKSLTTVERSGGEFKEQPEGRQVGETEDLIVFQKIDGQWQVLYAELNEPVQYRY